MRDDDARTMAAADRWAVIYVERPRCPGCGSVKLLAYHSGKQGDGSRLRYVRCGVCDQKAKMVLE